MPPQSRLWLLLLAACSGLVMSCRVAQPRSTLSSREQAIARHPQVSLRGSEISEEDLIEAYAHFGSGVIHEMNEEPELALQDYCEAALRDPQNEALVLGVTRRLVQVNRLDKALEILTRATAREGASGEVYARLGLVYSRLERNDLAIKANRQAIKKDPRSLAGYQNLFVNYLQAQQNKQALALLDEAAEIRGTDADFMIGLAELYANFGVRVPAQKQSASARALALLQQAKKSKDLPPQLQLKVADGLDLLGNDDEAAEIYTDLLKGQPDDGFIRGNIRAKLANIYLGGQNQKLAAEQLEALVRDNPTDVQAYYWLGRLACDEKKFSKGAEYFSKALLLKPDFELGYYELARAQVGADENRQALATLETARAKFPGNFALHYLSAIASLGEKDYTNALHYFNSAEICALAQDTNRLTSDFYFQYGAACERKGDFAQAEEHLEKCLQLAPNDAEALNYLGYMWADRGEKLDRACQYIQKALQSEPQNAAYLDSMGWVLFKLKQPQPALDYLLQAVRCSAEGDATLYDHLGDIYSALGEKEKAVESWSKSLSLEPNEQVRNKVHSAGN